RGALLDDAIEAVATAFRDEFPEHEGRVWHLHDMGIRPRPVQRPRPPIWVGGSSPAAIRRAAARGDGWLPQGTPKAEMPAAIETLWRQRRDVHGDDAPAIDIGAITPFLYVGEP